MVSRMASTSAAATSQVQTGQSTRVSEKANAERPKQVQRWGRLFRRGHVAPVPTNPSTSNGEDVEMKRRLEKWSMGVLNDKETEEVPGERCPFETKSGLHFPLGVLWNLSVKGLRSKEG